VSTFLLTRYWSHEMLTNLRDDAAAGMSLVECAQRQPGEVHSADCDLALWAMTGRSIPQALIYLNRRAAA